MIEESMRISTTTIGVAASLLILPDHASAQSDVRMGQCSPGFELVSLEDADRGIATWFDEMGNNDGYVCRRLLGDGRDGIRHAYPNATVDYIYHWEDNDQPPVNW